MDKEQAQTIVKSTFESPFDRNRFIPFIGNLLNSFEDSSFSHRGNLIPDAYERHISLFERIGKYTDGEHKIDILVVKLKNHDSIERARTMQRNFVARYLNGSRGGELRDAALVAFVAPDNQDWRFSLVKMDYRFEDGKNGKVKVKEEFTPARRWSFLVGANEKSHTAQTQLVPIIMDDQRNPMLKQLEEAFNIEKATKEFFVEYRDLFLWTKRELDYVVAGHEKVKADFEAKSVDTVNFAKKLLGQIVFLYFLQKKGWFGVQRDAAWGSGSKHFLRELFKGNHGEYTNFFNDILEPLFYEALRIDRTHDDDYYSRFNCKIPFLNGGLFDPIKDYDWVHTDILLPNKLFSNANKTTEGDTGNGVLDIFDRYNFTVKEDEPLEKEVAIDPELLGKAYEKFNAIRLDNYEEYKEALDGGKKGAENKFNKQYGVYYTPREIVHYMCQQSLINHLDTELNAKPTSYEKMGEPNLDILGNAPKKGQLDFTTEHKSRSLIPKEDLETLIKYGEQVAENEARVVAEGRETGTYYHKIPESIRKAAKLIDDSLADVKVCDPAVGSGAFLVGMMTEVVKARNALTAYLVPPDKGGNRGVQEPSSNPLNPPFQGDLSSFPPDKGETQGGLENFPPDKGGTQGGLQNFPPDKGRLKGVRTVYYFKRECIEKSLYGVDIDRGSVEIAKLRLWLSLVVDEEEIRRIKPLPNLDYKVVCGNSLLAFPGGLVKNVEIEHRIEELKPRYFSETNVSTKRALKTEIDAKFKRLVEEAHQYSDRAKGVTFDFPVHFSEVFREKGGFDVVIGNPPYVRQEKLKDQKPLFADRFETYTGSADLYVYFYERGVKILKTGGTLAFISSNKFFRARYGEELRRFLTEKTSITCLIDFGDLPVFEATTYPCVLVARRLDGNDSETIVRATTIKTEDELRRFEDVFRSSAIEIPQSSFGAEGWRIEEKAVLGLLGKIRRTGVPLGEYVGGKIYYGIKTGYNKAFVVDGQAKDRLIREDRRSAEFIKPLLRGRDIRRYSIRNPGLFLIYLPHRWTNEHRGAAEPETFLNKELPAIYAHLKPFEKPLKKRDDQGEYWWEMRPCRYLEEFEKPKIVYPNILKRPQFAFDQDGFFTNQKCFIITLSDKSLLGMLNSSLSYFLFGQTLPKLRGDFFEPGYFYFKDFPIAIPSESEHSEIEACVQKILDAKKNDPSADTCALEREVDTLVYGLYGLTEEEIRIVEGG